MSPLVSIIVPLYKVENCMSRALESIQEQTLENIEIILINDGSPDKSGEIADKYARKDKRIKVIHQNNKGVSGARNTGISEATGEYIGFVDPDDWIEADMFECLYTTAVKNDCDIVMCSVLLKSDKVNEELIKNPFIPNKVIDYKNIKNNIFIAFINESFHGYVWNKLYKKSLLLDNDVQFPLGITILEDCLFNWKAFTFAKKVYYISNPYYHYLITSSGATFKFRPDEFQQILYLYEEKLSYMEKWELNNCKNKVIAAELFIKKVILSIFSFYHPQNNESKLIGLKKICRIVNNKSVQSVLVSNKEFDMKGNLNKVMLFSLRYKFLPGLLFGSWYYYKGHKILRLKKQIIEAH